MASRIRKRSSFSVASRAWITLCRYCVIPIVARMTISETTTSSSIIVKPRSSGAHWSMRELESWWFECTEPPAWRTPQRPFNSPLPEFNNSSFVNGALPVPVLGAVERSALERGVDVEDVLPAPARRVGLVLVGSHPPFGGVRHRIDRDPAQELELPAGGVVRGADPIHQDLEIRGIAFAADLDVERANLAEIGGVLVFVDRRAHLAQRPPQLGLARALRGHLGERHDRRRQNRDQRRHHQHLDEAVTVSANRRRLPACPLSPVH